MDLMGDQTKECPVCGETIKAVALKCRFCGEDLRAFAQNQEQAVERELFRGRPAAIYSIGQYLLTILTLGLAYPFLLAKSLSVRYLITTQRIRIERGILSRETKIIELYRVDDFSCRFPLGMRLLGYGILGIKSSDADTPNLEICGVEGVDELYEQLRACALRERERRGVKVWADA